MRRIDGDAGRGRTGRRRPGCRWWPWSRGRGRCRGWSRAVADQGVAGGVDADRLDQVAQRDDVAAALAHPHDRAVAEQVDHLADDDLEVLAGLVAERRAHRHHPADVAVVVGPEQDDAAVEAALALVEVVGRVAGDVGAAAVGLDDHPVLVVAELLGGAARPRRPARRCCRARVSRVDRPLDGAATRAGRSRGTRRRRAPGSRAGSA